MPDADFQARLQRLSPSQQSGDTGSGDGGHRPDLRRLILGSVLTTTGVYLVAIANLNYDTIRERAGVEGAVGFGLLALAAVAVGVTLTLRALWKIRARGPVPPVAQLAATRPTTPAVQAKPMAARRASGLSRLVTSLLGAAMGVGTSACLFMAAAARFIETDQAQAFFGSAALVALLLAVVALTIGLVGLFVRGFSLGRVPFYFLVGAFFTWVAGYYLRLNLLGWPSFVNMLQ